MFPETILQINNGATVAELGDALQKVVATVRAVGKSGTVTLAIKVAPAMKNSTDVLTVEASVKTKLPESEHGATIFFATEDNRLVRNDPKQQVLPLRVIDMPEKGELKEVI